MAARVSVKRINKHFPSGSGLVTWNFDNRGAVDDDLADLSGNAHDLVWNAGSASHSKTPSGLVGMQFNNNRNLVAPNDEAFRIALDRLGAGDASLTIEIILGHGLTTNRVIGSWAGGESEATNYLYDLYRHAASPDHWRSFNERGNGSNIDIYYPNVPEASLLDPDYWPRYVALTVSANGRVRTCYVNALNDDPLVYQAVDTSEAQKETINNLQRTYIGASFTGLICGIRMWAETKNLAFLQASYGVLLGDFFEDALIDREAEGAGFEDAYDIPDAGGAPHHTFPEIGRGQFVPGPPGQESDAPHGTPTKAAFEERYDLPSVGGPPRYTATDVGEVGGGQHMPGPATQDPVNPLGPKNSGAYEDILYHLAQGAPEFNPGSFDVEGHPHFTGEQFFHAFYYNATQDPWHVPTQNNFTGYARNGKRYTNGSEDAGPVWAPWATESSSNHRSSRADFPLHVLIVTGKYEVVIFDLDSYSGAVNSLKVWMRFYWDDTNYMCLGQGALSVRDVKFANGVLIAASQYDSSPAMNGGIFTIDFKANGQSVFHVMRSDKTYNAVVGKTIVNRNGTGLWNDLSVTYIDSESIYRLEIRTEGTDTLYVGHVGEETPDPQITKLVDNAFVERFLCAGDDRGVDNLDDEFYKCILFDEQGWLWTSRENRIYRHGNRYAGVRHEGIHQNVGDTTLRPHVDLPHNVLSMVSARDRIYVGTVKGIYILERGTLEYWLGYTAVGGGGKGRLKTGTTEGEILKAAHSESYRLYAVSFDTASYLTVPQTYHRGGAVTIIRLYDDEIMGEFAAPDLTEDGTWFAIVTPV